MRGTNTRVRIFETQNNQTIFSAIEWSFCRDLDMICKTQGSWMIETQNKEVLLYLSKNIFGKEENAGH